MYKQIFSSLRIFISLISFLAFLNNSNLYANGESSMIVKGNARFTIITPELIRIEYSPTGKFIDNRTIFAENRQVSFSEFTKEEKDGKLIIETTKFKLVYIPDDQPFSPSNLSVSIQKGNEIIIWKPGMKNKENLGGTISTLDQVRGKVPLDDGILSRDGWYLLDDSKEPLLTENWVMSRSKDSGIDWYLFAYGYDFKQALKALTTIGGKIPLPRKYMLGSWYSRYWPYSSEEYIQIVKEYEENRFPLDVMVMDMDWHKDGWTGWSWNKKLIPEPEKLLKFFHDKGLKVTLNVHPSTGIAPHEDMYMEFMKDMGIDLSKTDSNKYPTLPYDAGDKNYLDKLFKHTHEPLEKSGVDFWWLDWQQFKYTKSIPDLKNLAWLNRYYFNYTSKNNNRGASFSRWGGNGDHKYPIHFSGDALSIWPMLEFEVPFTSASGNIGCFFWSHDIGGHFGGLDQETNARWVQFGATTAALRLHSTRDKNMDKRPWLYDKIYIKSNQIAFQLRSVIFPYIYSSVWRSCKETLPLNRPMYIEYPEKEIAYHNPQQYFFGDAMLIAPIVQPGTGKNKIASQKVWFPEGLWYNWFTNEKYEGSENLINVWSDIFEFPVFIKGGIPIPLQNLTMKMASEPLMELIIRVYPGKSGQTGKFTLYEDDGITNDYLNGKYAITNMEYLRDDNNYILKIYPTVGSFEGQIKRRSYVVEFAATEQTDSAIINSKKIKVEYDKMQMNRIKIPAKSIDEMIEIKLSAAQIDYSINKEATNKIRISPLFDRKIDFIESRRLLDEFISKNPNPQDLFLATSLFSGLSIYLEDNNIAYILKDAESKAKDNIRISIQDIIGNDKKNIIIENITLKNGENKIYKVEKPLKELTGIKSQRIITVNFDMEGKEYSISKIMDEKDSYIEQWNIIGPFNYNKKKNIADFIHKPEKEKSINLKDEYKGKDNKKIKWQTVKTDSDKILDVTKYFYYDDGIMYGLVYLKSDQDQDIKLRINSDDGVEVLLNHEKIHSNNIFRAIVHEPDIVKGKLKKGINILLIKVSQGEGGWGYRVGIDSQYPLEVLLIDKK